MILALPFLFFSKWKMGLFSKIVPFEPGPIVFNLMISTAPGYFSISNNKRDDEDHKKVGSVDAQ